MYYTALVDFKNKKIFYPGEHKTREEAGARFSQLAQQAELNTRGLGGDFAEHGEWKAYIGEKPFAFPKPEKNGSKKDGAE